MVFEKNIFEKDEGAKRFLKTTEVETFSFSIQIFPRWYKHVKFTKTKTTLAPEAFNIPKARSWKGLLNGNIFWNFDWNYYHQNLENNLKHGIRQWKHLNNSGVLCSLRKVLKRSNQR